jgi:hypothetical protein
MNSNLLKPATVGIEQGACKAPNPRTAFGGGGVTQGSSESDAEQERFKRNQLIEEIKDERVEIQFVIDGESGRPMAVASGNQKGSPRGLPS